VAAGALNSEVVPFFDSHGILLLRILTDQGSEYCGNREHHEYALYLDLEDIEHTRTKVRSPQTNGICERFNKTCKDEFYSVAFRRKVYRDVEEIQLDLNVWLCHYNNERTHSGKYCYGKTPMRTFVDSIPFRWPGKSFLATTNLTDRVREFPRVSDQVLSITRALKLFGLALINLTPCLLTRSGWYDSVGQV